ncbi:hypothetical protein GALMADRAFT_139606 [Galerina marginata CBS 339.88]|uniref:Uncharacterized protein n=1 Tax=Galerina marginata (strain CBS 339.88) TaxID=685588 RepID=A0A067T2Z5_GALM3|nr:hypothetical protein GALMADRAFT_139606 [Galerina marginata CBS 339.88]
MTRSPLCNVVFDLDQADEQLLLLPSSRPTELLGVSPRSSHQAAASLRRSASYSSLFSVDENTLFVNREIEEGQEVIVPLPLAPPGAVFRQRQGRTSGPSSENDIHPYQLPDPQYAWTPSPSSSTNFFDSPPVTGTSHSYSRLHTVPKRRRHPFADGYEVPSWKRLIIHLVLCALAYPFLLIFVVASAGRDLFWTRLLVGAGCGLLGFALGSSLLNLATGILEAATWATVVHQSRVPNAPGIKLQDLDGYSRSPKGAQGALRLLWNRHWYEGAARKSRKAYDARHWSFWILFFLLNVVISGSLSFLLGRVTDINVRVTHQYQDYQEVVIAMDISDQDIKQALALQSVFEDFTLTWTMAPFSMHGSMPPVVSFAWKNDTIYFSEVIPSQLVAGGAGFGTFLQYTTASTNASVQDPEADLSSNGVALGAVLRQVIAVFPRWGIRIKCAKIPEIPNNLVPVSTNGFTYLFTPRETIRSLFQDFNMSIPGDYEKPFNFSSVVASNDTLPSGLNTSSVVLGALFSNNGVANSMKSMPVTTGDNGSGFVTLEHVLVRLNDSFAPNGTFGIKVNSSVPDKQGFFTSIGYDAAVCLELYEPWVLEVYNSSAGLPSSMRIVDKAAVITDLKKEKLNGPEITNPLVKRNLNSTNLSPVYLVSHQNSINQIVKDNGRDSFYVPSPTLISFTSGNNPLGYTELSEVYYAKARALADASNVLPYFAGSGLTVARRYSDQVVTKTKIVNVEMVVIISVVCLMGCISALFVPRLPLDAPRRGFDLYSWFAAFYAQELVADKRGTLNKHMDLHEVVEYAEGQRFFYTSNTNENVFGVPTLQ